MPYDDLFVSKLSAGVILCYFPTPMPKKRLLRQSKNVSWKDGRIATKAMLNGQLIGKNQSHRLEQIRYELIIKTGGN
jgi:hypothetical protein